MPISHIRLSDGSRDEVLEYIRIEKNLGSFTVIDIGGGIYSWCYDYIDALLDLVKPPDSNKLIFEGDMNIKSTWDSVYKYVQENGKFDFCICTHTLEDIRDPLFVCQQMETIAKRGYIAIPSKHRELARFEFGENGPRGYIHHRWIFDIQDNQIMGFPKLPFLEHIKELDSIASTEPAKCDLSFYWADTIDLTLCNGDYMGPNARSVLNYFNRLQTPFLA